MQTLIDSEMREMEVMGEKKKKAYKDMQVALELKEQQRAAEL